MKYIDRLSLLMCMPIVLVSCVDLETRNSSIGRDFSNNDSSSFSISMEEDFMNKTISLLIGSEPIDVSWEDNTSVSALKKRAEDGLTIKMRKYGGFEQVGSLGTSLPSNDVNMKTEPGDICLYSSNQIVVFYGSNTWDYTKLGHINLSIEELQSLLGEEAVTLVLELKDK